MNKVFDKKFEGFYILTMAFAYLGLETGDAAYNIESLKTVFIGILSATTLVFSYLLFGSPRSRFAKVKIEFPEDWKYFVLWFFLAFIGYLALRYIVEAILYFF